jgi:hypothetical protein
MARLFAPWNGQNLEAILVPVTIALVMCIALFWVIRRRRQKPNA